MENMKKQSEKFGTRIITETVEEVNLLNNMMQKNSSVV